MTFGELIKGKRKKLGISQTDLAKRIGVSRAAISRYESGERTNIAAPIVSAIADALAIDYTALIESCVDIDFSFPESSNDIRKHSVTYDEIYSLLWKLNNDGLEEAKRQISLLTQIPKYQRDFEDEMNHQIQSEYESEMQSLVSD